jgi:CheY-like chemotaxis protein
MERRVSGTVLVVDDDPLHRALVRDQLQPAGFIVLEAADGVEGLARARVRKPDVILLDAMMPRLDGFATCEQLKADPATLAIPVIFVTGSPDRSVNVRAYALGALACIRKPFHLETLLAMVQVALSHRASPHGTLEGGV